VALIAVTDPTSGPGQPFAGMALFACTGCQCQSVTRSETLLDHWMMKSTSIGMISKIQPLIDHREFLQSNSTNRVLEGEIDTTQS
jgi:hypothetical protein